MVPPSFLANKKLAIKNAVLILLLAFLALIVLKAFYLSSQRANSVSRSLALVECYRAEMLMRMADAAGYLSQSSYGMQKKSQKNVLQTYDKVVCQAKDLLSDASTKEPYDTEILAKKMILDERVGQDIKPNLARLSLICAAEEKKDLSNSSTAKFAKLILAIYGSGLPASSSTPPQSNAAIFSTADIHFLEGYLSDGWYKEQVLLRVYKLNHQDASYQKLFSAIKNKTWLYVFKLVLIGFCGTIAALVGVVVIIYQLVIVGNRPVTMDTEAKKMAVTLKTDPAKFGWQTVACVFLAWFFTQIVIGYSASLLKQKGLSFSFFGSFASAISIALIYLLSNGPALLYIYLFALRPNGLKFAEGINFRWQVDKHGAIALILVGILGWFAAMPLVIAAYFISANLFGSSGSSNPVIAIVMEAAQQNNFWAILLFYFTLGVLAPLCEEGLFRGFFYKYLRSRHSILVANVLSSGLFAIAHLDLGAVLPLFCLGSIFAYLYETTDSIVPAMVAHGLWNSITFTLVLMLFGS